MITIKSIKPMFDGLVTTAKRLVEDVDETSNRTWVSAKVATKALNDIQTVLFVGEMAKNMGINKGDIIRMDFRRYLTVEHKDGAIEGGTQGDKMSFSENVPRIYINGEECLFVHTNDVVYIIDDKEITGGGILQTEYEY